MSLFDDAVRFALEAHGGVFRRHTATPYILHPMEAAAIVASMTTDEAVLAAAILHDTVEDASVAIEQIREKFGGRVADLVASETEDKRRDMPPEETWRIRKEESLAVLKNAQDIGVKILWMGDKLSNMRSFYALWRKKGDALWENSHQKDVSQQAWYYRSVAEYTQELREYPAWQEYVRLVDAVFGKEDS